MMRALVYKMLISYCMHVQIDAYKLSMHPLSTCTSKYRGLSALQMQVRYANSFKQETFGMMVLIETSVGCVTHKVQSLTIP